MSIGAANTFTRNIWKPFIHPRMSPQEESVLAKLASLAVKIGALAVIFFMPTRFALDLQLLGGVWMVQIFPAMILGLYTRWFSGWALLIGWAAGMIVGTSLSWTGPAWVPVHALKWDAPLVGNVDLGLGFAAYNGLTAVILNLLLSAALSLVLRSRAGMRLCPRTTKIGRSPEQWPIEAQTAVAAGSSRSVEQRIGRESAGVAGMLPLAMIRCSLRTSGNV